MDSSTKPTTYRLNNEIHQNCNGFSKRQLSNDPTNHNILDSSSTTTDSDANTNITTPTWSFPGTLHETSSLSSKLTQWNILQTVNATITATDITMDAPPSLIADPDINATLSSSLSGNGQGLSQLWDQNHQDKPSWQRSTLVPHYQGRHHAVVFRTNQRHCRIFQGRPVFGEWRR